MDEYISRESMLKNLTSDLEHHSDEGDPRTYLVMRRFIKYVEDFPTADVQPVKHGEWKFYKNNGIYDTYKCSICKESFELPMDADISQEIRYCPNCGANMREKEGE